MRGVFCLSNKLKSVAIIKEKMEDENRVIVCPHEVRIFVTSGYDVYVEAGSGDKIGFGDEDYVASGAKILSENEIWKASNYVLKYKPPLREEYGFLRENLVVGAIFHAEGNPEMMKIYIL
jgi:alanine dehydrogenase